jgi:ketosteroid isomerase-like protein
MAEHSNAVLLRQITDAMRTGDMTTLETLVADDIVWHEIGRSEPTRGKDALRSEMGAADYGIAYETHDVIANDEHAVVLGEATATRGGRTLRYRTVEIYHVRDGRIVERWAFSDDTQRIIDFFA